LSEDIIFWNSAQFKLIEIGDDFTTGSSIMPQKKNPDIAELARGKTGRVYGDLVSLLTTLKGLPLTYNRDLQEDKESLFDGLDTVAMTLEIFTQMLKTIKVNKESAASHSAGEYILATDLADYLVQKDIPFREAHKICGEIVAYGVKNKKDLPEFKLEEFKKFSVVIEEDIFKVLTLDSSVNARDIYGGTAKKRVLEQLEIAKKGL
jgi:argininosuccinate lyase